MQILSLGSTNRMSNMYPKQRIPAEGSALAGLLPTWVTPHVFGIIRSRVRRQHPLTREAETSVPGTESVC